MRLAFVHGIQGHNEWVHAVMEHLLVPTYWGSLGNASMTCIKGAVFLKLRDRDNDMGPHEACTLRPETNQPKTSNNICFNE